MTEAVVAPAPLSSPSVDPRATLIGVLCGMAAAAIWGAYFGLARAGAIVGFTPIDFVVMRILPGALCALPIIYGRGLVTMAGVGWPRAGLLALTTGPLFVMLATGGFQFAPLAHGAVLQPGTMTLSSVFIGAALFGDKISSHRLLGALTIVIGLILVAGSGFLEAGSQSYIGDMMFACAGLSWALYTALLRRWQIEAVSGTAANLFISGLIALPLGLITGAFSHLATFPWTAILTQSLVQGVLAGFFAMILYARSVTLLGGGRATLFAAIVPVVAMLLGIPITGEWPSALQWAGAVIVTLGLLLGLGLIDTVRAGRASFGKT